MFDLCSKNCFEKLNYYAEKKWASLFSANWWEKDTFYTQDQKSDINFCYNIFNKIADPYVAILTELPPMLSLEIIIFYLTHKALTIIECDKELFGGDIEKKTNCLKQFYKSYPCYNKISEDKYRFFMKNYDRVGRVFNLLPSKVQNTIQDMCKNTSAGMITCIKNNHTINTIDEYNQYCDILAGNPMHQLTKLIILHGYETSDLSTFCETEKSELHSFGGCEKSLGIFLQKTCIIYNYFEDMPSERFLWPKEIWKKHKNDFAGMGYDSNSRACLNEMILDALRLIPDILKYISKLRSYTYRRLCLTAFAIALTTLKDCFNNPTVFKEVTGISRTNHVGELTMETDSIDKLCNWLENSLKAIKRTLPLSDPNYIEIRDVCDDGICHARSHCSETLEKPKECCLFGCIKNVSIKLMWGMFLACTICIILSLIICGVHKTIVEDMQSAAMHGAWVGSSAAITAHKARKI